MATAGLAKKKSFLKITWDGVNYFFQSVLNFINKTFSGISNFIKNYPILVGISGLFLFFLEGCIFTLRGMIIESVFTKIYNISSKAYKALRLDKLFDLLKKTEYILLGNDTKLKIQAEILSYKIIDDFIEKIIEKKDEFFIFNHNDIKNLTNTMNESINEKIKNINASLNGNQINSFIEDELESNISDFLIKFSNNIKDSLKNLKQDNILFDEKNSIIKSAKESNLKTFVSDNIKAKTRAKFSEAIFSELKNFIKFSESKNSEKGNTNKDEQKTFTISLIEAINTETKYREKSK